LKRAENYSNIDTYLSGLHKRRFCFPTNDWFYYRKVRTLLGSSELLK